MSRAWFNRAKEVVAPEKNVPTNFRLEHLAEPLGIDQQQPRLSWWLPKGARRQLAYRLRTEDWDSGRIESENHLLVALPGAEMRSRQCVECAVKVWTDQGESEWSDILHWEMGLLDPGDWKAEWIEPPEGDEIPPSGQRPAWHLRHDFSAANPPVRARLYATALGLYEIHLNGERVGDIELAPGYTSYDKILQVQTYDVAGLIKPGPNSIDALLSDGWYRGQTGAFRQFNQYGERTAFLAQLEMEFADGSGQLVTTNKEWSAAVGAVRAADLMQGVVFDCRQAVHATSSGEPPANWRPVTVTNHSFARLRSSPSPPVRRIEEVTPIEVRVLDERRQLVDLGQNIAGWLRLSDLGPADSQLRLTYGEALDVDGDVTTENIDSSSNAEELGLPEAAKMPEEIGPLQVDEIYSAGRMSDVFEPRMSTKGFRYVRVEGHPHTLSSDDISGVVVHSDLRRTGWFECSETRLNRLHEAAVWTLRSNMVDIPTDCPHRERSGWGSEWQIFLSSAAFLYDVAGFTTKWLRDLAADQKSDGAVFHYAPNNCLGKSEAMLPAGAAGYSDAAVIVPWGIYRAYGDAKLLADQWESMSAWVDWSEHAARTKRHPARVKSRPVPALHEQYLRDTGVHFGEWLAPPSPIDQSNSKLEAGRDDGDFATAYFHYSTKLLGRIARVLGKEADAERYEKLAEKIGWAWWTEYGNADGTIRRPTQANYVRALAFELAPQNLRKAVAANLVESVRAADTHVGTGTFGTALLLPVLADAGYADLAYELLLRETPPSWRTMLDRGATTIWEMWDGVDEKGKAHFSLNHFAFGAVIDFMHTHIAGIRLDDATPAYRRFRIEPVPGGGIRWARGHLLSPYGPITSEWHVDSLNRLRLDVEIPAGTSADVRLPNGTCAEIQCGRSQFDCDLV